MKAILKTLYLFIGSSILFLSGCQDHNAITPVNQIPSQVTSFLKEARSTPVLIEGKQMDDSWRVVHKKYHYHDGTDINGNEIVKEFDLDMSKNPLPANTDFGSDYKENWIFGKDSVMFVLNGSLKDGKTFYNYNFEKFMMSVDENLGILTINYVFDNGTKKYSTPWTITFISDTELTLTVQDLSTDYFYQYTLEKENL